MHCLGTHCKVTADEDREGAQKTQHTDQTPDLTPPTSWKEPFISNFYRALFHSQAQQMIDTMTEFSCIIVKNVRSLSESRWGSGG